MPKILVTPKSFQNYKEEIYPLIAERGFDIVDNRLGRTLTEEEIVEFAAEGVVGIIVGVDPLPGTVLERCKDLRAVSKYGMGVDNIDLVRAKELGIEVRNAAGTNHISVAEHAIGLLFAIARHIPQDAAAIKQGRWGRTMGTELTGKTAGVIGGGQIGREFAVRAKGLGMNVVIHDPYFAEDDFLKLHGIGRIRELDALLGMSEVVSLHAPYTPETKHLVDRQALACMRKSAFLINTSRGELVDEVALYEALVNGTIAGAASDVFSTEPPEADNKLLGLDNFLLTAHSGAYTKEGVERMAKVSARNLLEMLAQTPQ